MKYLEEKEKKYEDDKMKNQDQVIIQLLRNKMISNVYKKMVIKTGMQLCNINQESHNLCRNILLKSLRDSRNVNNGAEVDDMFNIFDDITLKKEKEKTDYPKIKLEFQDNKVKIQSKAKK